MKKIKYTCEISECTLNELLNIEKKLIDWAQKALLSAYAPYSNFKVGCAVLFDDDSFILGSNQENAAYPSGLCAERVALFSAGSQFPDKKIKAIAITTSNSLTEPIAPCGACRQVMVEYELKQQTPFKIFLINNEQKIYMIQSAAELLPLLFRMNN